MRKSLYFILFTIFIIATSCSLSEFEPVKGSNDDCIQVVGRVVSFASRDVDTRAGKSFDESATYSMCLARFNSSSVCQDVKYSKGSNITFTINKADLSNGDKLYVFANIADPELGTGKTLEQYLAIATDVQGVEIQQLNVDGKNEKCLPMIGSYTIEDKDNLPSLVPIPLEALFAKIVVTINVTPDQKIDGIDPASFTLDRWEVHNVATTVDFLGGTVGETDDVVDVYDDPFEGQLDPYENNFAQGTEEVSFSFYLPERFLKPETAAEDFTYPFGSISDLDEDEARRYPQRYKPLLVEGRNATFVRFFGEFIDHQTHNYKVSYDLYLGNDNYSNFDIERNKQYNNQVTIRGIKTSSDESTNEQAISIDHRVNVTRVEPIITNLRRETELDSHFEIRPLRIRKNPDYTGVDQNASIKVEVIYKDQAGERWVGLERSFGNGVPVESSDTYLVEDDLPDSKQNIAGKRKYFTTDLTTVTLGTEVTGIPVTEDGECVWIYVDEAKVANAADAMRSATIRVSYQVNGATYGDPIDYVIRQHELFPVTYTNGTASTSDDYEYLIEYHEEYLHNYDADDSYGQTDYEGMKWGLYGAQLSFENRALFVDAGGISSVTSTVNDIVADYSPFYDFYLTTDTDKDGAFVYSHAGHTFCERIIDNLSDSDKETNTDEIIDVMHLGEEPKSAIEYCYNRNKRDADGKIADEDVVWYLPAIDEMEEIVMSQYKYDFSKYAYSQFPDFRAKKYWSSQPAYLNNFVHADRIYRLLLWDTDGDRTGTYMTDNPQCARATSVSYNGLGADDPDNYDKIKSGMSGYYELLTIWWRENTLMQIVEGPTETHTRITTTTVVDWSNNDGDKSTTLNPMQTDPGYLDRNANARVRCVYKPKN